MLFNYRLLNKYEAELKCVAELLYYLMTTLRKEQTLGEEYCALHPQHSSINKFPTLSRRIVSVALLILSPYLLNKLAKKY